MKSKWSKPQPKVGEVTTYPKMSTVYWARDGDTISVTYHIDTKLTIGAPHQRLLYIPYNDVASMLTQNGWAQMEES